MEIQTADKFPPLAPRRGGPHVARDGIVAWEQTLPSDLIHTSSPMTGDTVELLNRLIDEMTEAIDDCPSDAKKLAPGQCGCGVPDTHSDGDVDQADFGRFQTCLTGQAVPVTDPNCLDANLDGDSDVDQDDYVLFRGCMTGANVIADPHCAD